MTPREFRANAAAAYEAEKARYEPVLYIHGSRWFVQSSDLRELHCECAHRSEAESFITDRAMQAMLLWMAENVWEIWDDDGGANEVLCYLANGSDDEQR